MPAEVDSNAAELVQEAPVASVPTFMKEPAPPFVPAAPSWAASTTAKPFALATAAIDVSEILKPAVPFDPGGPPATAAAVARLVTPSQARARMSAETTAVDVSKILGAAVPFGEKGAGAAVRRLVRFDPQTGQRLATPYWEELPTPEEN